MFKRTISSITSKCGSFMSHTRNIEVLHLGNKIIFDVPLYFENGMIIKDVRIESNRLLVNCIKRMDVEKKEELK